MILSVCIKLSRFLIQFSFQVVFVDLRKTMLLTGIRKKERKKRRGRFSLQADFLVGVSMDTQDDFVKPLPLSLLRQCKLAVALVD